MNIRIGKVTITDIDLNLVGQDPRALCGSSCPKSQKFARNIRHTCTLQGVKDFEQFSDSFFFQI